MRRRPSSTRNGISSTPPTPTVPMNRPTTAATAASRPAEIKSLAPLRPDHLAETGELVFLHEHRMLGAGIAARAYVVAVVAEAFLDDRHALDVHLRVPRHAPLVHIE